MQLAGTSASLTAVGRCVCALPVLGAMMVYERRRGSSAGILTARGRWLARLAGCFLAADLIVWSHAISAIGAGLATVVPNLQVVVIALLGWFVLRERPDRSLLLAAPAMIAGLALVRRADRRACLRARPARRGGGGSGSRCPVRGLHLRLAAGHRVSWPAIAHRGPVRGDAWRGRRRCRAGVLPARLPA